ncbi:MAG: hypothetical protein ACR2RA_23920 [Geminicoccaceae bacterium]
MSLDVSDAIELARDLLQTSSDFQAHDPDLAAEFAGRAFEICDDFGIDRALIGDSATIDAVDQPLEGETETVSVPATPVTDSAEVMPGDLDDDARQTSDQLSALLQQQARVLRNARENGAAIERPKAAKRSFWRFGRSAQQPFGALQSA